MFFSSNKIQVYESVAKRFTNRVIEILLFILFLAVITAPLAHASILMGSGSINLNMSNGGTAGDYLWFSLIVTNIGISSSALSAYSTPPLIISVSSTSFNVPGTGGTNIFVIPAGEIEFSSTYPSTPTTTFTGGEWITQLNTATNFNSQIFLTGALDLVSYSFSSPGPVSWSETFTLSNVNSGDVTTFSSNGIQWQAQAAQYSFSSTYFPSGPSIPSIYSSMGVNPIQSGSASPLQGAGAPENFDSSSSSYLTGVSLLSGGTGGGGGNYTGSASNTDATYFVVNTVPETPVGTIAALGTLLAALAVFGAMKMRSSKTKSFQPSTALSV